VKDGIIEPDSEFGRQIGFTSDKFEGWLLKKGDVIYISLIINKQPEKDNLSKLLDNILRLGYTIKVPTPLGVIELKECKKGFRLAKVWWDLAEEWVDVWVKSLVREEGRLKRRADER